MGIQVDWQIVEEDGPSAREEAPAQLLRPRLRWKLVVVAALAVLVIATIAVGVMSLMYRSRLGQVVGAVKDVARLEARAIAANDKPSFMAIQDPEDSLWRDLQSQRFARLEREGFLELGWKIMGVAPRPGDVSLEPGGARLDVTYRFAVAQPMPTGPLSVTLRTPQYYRQTPEGWVRAMPGQDFWGAWRKLSGKHIVVIYAQRDADVIEPLAPRLEKIVERVCEPMLCPAQLPITFSTSADSMSRLGFFSYGYGATGLVLPSPHLIGLPVDEASRQELYRAYETRLVQALVYEASNRQLDTAYYASQEFVRWQMAQAGLSGPFINEAITRTFSASLASARQPLASIALRSAPVRLELRPGQIAVPLAFDYLERQVGRGAVSRLLPALASNNVQTMGDAITMALRVNPATLEPAWTKYLREWESSLETTPGAPDGELALWCAREADARSGSAIVRMRLGGTGAQFTDGGPWVSNTWPPHWSPDGKALAYAQGDNVSARVIVMDADHRTFKVVSDGLAGAPWVEWLPAAPERLQIAAMTTHIVNLETGASTELAGTRHTWSPDGQWMAFQWPDINPLIWVAGADGHDAREVAQGDKLVWSPDSRRLAFLGLPSTIERFNERQIQIADVVTGSVKTLARDADLVKLLTGSADGTGSLTDLDWSPDGSMLAVGVAWSSGSAVVVMDAASAVVRAQWQWGWTRVGFPSRAWSADNRHLAVWLAPDAPSQSVPSLLDVQTGVQVDLAGTALDWSPDGTWLAVAQEPSGLLLVRTDLSVSRWLDTPACFDVAWRPERRK